MTVFVQGSIGQPLSLLKALGDAGDALRDVRFVSVLTPGVNSFPVGSATSSRVATFFDYRDLRRSFGGSVIDFIPSHYSDIIRYLESLETIDLALIQLSPPDCHGMCSAGISADFVPDILAKCRTVICELNAGMPRTEDASDFHLDSLDYIVETDYALPQIPSPPADATADKIAQNAASLVRDGDTLQFGVGRIPQLVPGALYDRIDLGLHSGLITSVVRPLIEGGSMTGLRKSIDTAKHVTGAAVGDGEFYDWLGAHPDFAFRPVSYTHDRRILGTIDNLVAINSVLEVDLFGQANAEMINGQQVSGSGGLVDFIRGARMSTNGRAIICLQSTSNNRQRSNIVTRLNSVVTVCRTDLQYVVTEYGIADLNQKSIDEKAHALIAVAAPEFRDALRDSWAKQRQAQ